MRFGDWLEQSYEFVIEVFVVVVVVLNRLWWISSWIASVWFSTFQISRRVHNNIKHFLKGTKNNAVIRCGVWLWNSVSYILIICVAASYNGIIDNRWAANAAWLNHSVFWATRQLLTASWGASRELEQPQKNSKYCPLLI